MRPCILVVATLTCVGVQPSRCKYSGHGNPRDTYYCPICGEPRFISSGHHLLSWRNGHHNPSKSKFRSPDISHLSMVQGQFPIGYLGHENIPSLRQYHGTTIPVEIKVESHLPEIHHSERVLEAKHSDASPEVKHSELSSEGQLSEHVQNVKHSELVPEIQFLQTSPDLYKSETVTTTQNYVTEQETRSSSFTPEFHHSEYFYKTTNSEPEPEFQKQEVALEFQPTNFPFDLQKHEGEGAEGGEHYRGMTKMRQPEIFTGDANLGFSLNSQLIEETQQTTTELSFISLDPSQFQHEQASYLTRKQVSNLQHEQTSSLQHEQASSLQHEQSSNLQHEQTSSLQHEQSSNLQHEQTSSLQHEQASSLQNEQVYNLQHEQVPNLQHEQVSILQHEQASNLQHKQASSLQHEQSSNLQHKQASNLPHEQASYMPHRQDSNPFLPENPPQDKQEILYQTPLVDFQQQQYNSEMSAGIDNNPQQIRLEHSFESNQELKFSEHDSPKNLNTLEFVEGVRDGELSEQGSSTQLNNSPEGINTAVSNFDQSSNQTSVNSKWNMLDADPMPLQSQKGFDFSPPSYQQPNLNNFASPVSYQSMSGLQGSSMGSYGTAMGSSIGSSLASSYGSSLKSSMGSSLGIINGV
uniref:Uncharacterized protein n=1 Tax=Timema cristinae TaxID=61476 RepID=A0A7R9DJ47_TIMCR|nr:unnamed protein product [Timema cristinae]